MRSTTLDLLRCPFCGMRLSLVDGRAQWRDDEIVSAVLGCQCCAFPVVDGIPVLIADDRTRTAMHRLEAGEPDAALHGLLDLDDERAAAFAALRRRSEPMTYRDAIAVLSVDAEGQYFVYRFSDPTFLVAQALLRALASNPRLAARTIDLCGGSGHLTRVLTALSPPGQAMLADVFFWKLWLARTFTAPGCEPVCCDANNPLPFAGDAFSMVVCSDAFPYIWQKRLLTNEMMRLAGPDGVVVMPHLHSALGENFTAGMTLTPEGYRDLLQPQSPRLFRDSTLLDDLLRESVVDLTHETSPGALGGEAALAVVASRDPAVYRRYDVNRVGDTAGGELIVNPLYQVAYRDGTSTLTLSFPTPEYAEEFAAARRYLPDTLAVAADLRGPLDAGRIPDVLELRSRLVLLDAPARYC